MIDYDSGIVEEAEEILPKVRNVHKWQILSEVKLPFNFVFADNPEDAILKAREMLDVPAETGIQVRRVKDLEVLDYRLN